MFWQRSHDVRYLTGLLGARGDAAIYVRFDLKATRSVINYRPWLLLDLSFFLFFFLQIDIKLLGAVMASF